MADNNQKVRCADDAAIYDDIEFCMGDKSLPGTRNHAYYIPRRDIVTFPRPAAEPASLEAVAVITASFVLAADKNDPRRWQEVEDRLQHQQQNAREWRQTCLDYFRSFAGLPAEE